MATRTTPLFNDYYGNVGIGVDTPTNFKLQVAGNIGPDTGSTYSLGTPSAPWLSASINTVVGSIIGSSSYARNSTSASNAVSSSVSFTSSLSVTSSFSITSSYALSSIGYSGSIIIRDRNLTTHSLNFIGGILMSYSSSI